MNETTIPPPGECMNPHAIAALKHGEAAATRLRHPITSAHVLLGIVISGSGIAGRVVQHIGVYPEPLEAWLRANIPSGDVPRALPAELICMLRRAVDVEARRLKHMYVGGEHFLLAMTRPTRRFVPFGTPPNHAADAMSALAVDPAKVRERLFFEWKTLG